MDFRLIRYMDNGVEFLGKLYSEDNMIMPIDISNNMNELIVNFDRFKKHILHNNTPMITLDSIKLLSPIKNPMQDIICLGINYMEHAEESMRFKKQSFDGIRKETVYFGKRVNECMPPDSIFINKDVTKQLDYEVELVVIIGKDCRNASIESAMDFVFGYSVGNDISARDLQSKHNQWYAGKSLEGAFPMGPCIVLRDSIDISNLYIRSYVNGELRQNSNTSKLIFNVAYVIAELSSYFTIKAGSIISMGTPSGVGMGFQPPKFLHDGDMVECEIGHIGKITTKISRGE